MSFATDNSEPFEAFRPNDELEFKSESKFCRGELGQSDEKPRDPDDEVLFADNAEEAKEPSGEDVPLEHTPPSQSPCEDPLAEDTAGGDKGSSPADPVQAERDEPFQAEATLAAEGEPVDTQEEAVETRKDTGDKEDPGIALGNEEVEERQENTGTEGNGPGQEEACEREAQEEDFRAGVEGVAAEEIVDGRLENDGDEGVVLELGKAGDEVKVEGLNNQVIGEMEVGICQEANEDKNPEESHPRSIESLDSKIVKESSG
mmetsp:Transcript_25526/g.29337  ORF Transcript_25526/g.29337 Transcript_25526/m.29337 type:complete len:260 (-) Transcript_25526:4-783(-)